jgi:hypothetical protein
MALVIPVGRENPDAISFQVYRSGSGKLETLVGIGVAVAIRVGFGTASIVLVGSGASVNETAEGKGVNGIVAEGVLAATVVEEGCTTVGDSPTQLDIKITNKVNMASLDEFNVIKRSFVIHRDCGLMLEYRPKIIVYWTSFGNNLNE